MNRTEKILKRLLVSAIIIVLICAASLCSGCGRTEDAHLTEAEKIIEDHPDSALKTLLALNLENNATEHDRHLFNLLLIHARYKNFIDEENDSLIRSSAEYFTREGDATRATKALFLTGMTQMAHNKLGDAARSLTQGADLATQNGLYFWEGMCSRGLFQLYNRLYDGSSQLKYARKAYDAFSKTGMQDWIEWSRLNLAMAFSNNGQYKKALSEAYKATQYAYRAQDSTLMKEALTEMAICEMATERYSNALSHYLSIYRLFPDELTGQDKDNIAIAASEINPDSIPIEITDFISSVFPTNDRVGLPYEIFATNGDYEAAYRNLIEYRNEQDSVIALIMRNNVAETLKQYEETQKKIQTAERHNERILWFALLLAVIIAVGIAIRILIIQTNRQKEARQKAEADLDELDKNFKDMMEKARLLSEFIAASIREKYEKVNSLFDQYYDNPMTAKERTVLKKEIDKIVADFKDEKYLTTVAADIDKCTDGLYSSFKNDFADKKTEFHRLYLYILLGFSTRTISLISGLEPSAVYNHKSRLKKAIRESAVAKKDGYLKAL